MTVIRPSTASLRSRHLLLLLGLCVALVWLGIGRIGLVDPDEPFYALTAREMLQRGDWITPHIFGAPQFEKPILYYWMTMVSFVLFGATEAAARAVPALFGTLLVLLVYEFGRRLFRPRAAFLAAIVLATSVASIAMSRTVLTDVVFATFVTAALYCYWRAIEAPERSGPWIVLHFVASALSVLTKGPLGTLLVWLAIGAYRLFGRKPRVFRGKPLVGGVLAYVVLAVPWFAVMLWKYGWAYFQEFFVHENYERLIRAEHPSNNHWYYYLLILSVGMVPWMPVLALALLRLRSTWRRPSNAFLVAWLVPNLLFLTAAQSKLPSYAFFLFVPIALWLGSALDGALEEAAWRPRERALVIGLGVVQGLALLVGAAAKHGMLGSALAIGAGLAGATLLSGTIGSFRRASWSMVVAACAAVAILEVAALGFGEPVLDREISVRTASQKLCAEEPSSLPVITEKLLVRGVSWYTRRPVAVLANSRQPFWTAQNVEILLSRDEVDAYLARHGGASCLMRPKKGVWKLLPGGSAAAAASNLYFGSKVVTHFDPPGPEDATGDVRPGSAPRVPTATEDSPSGGPEAASPSTDAADDGRRGEDTARSAPDDRAHRR